jgi:hypothetical protein
MSVADALPVFHHRERHSTHVAASPAAALEAARAVSLGDLALVRLLLRLRGLRRGGRRTPVWEALLAEGFQRFGDDTLVLVGKPWRLRGALRTVEDFVAFAEPGYAKMAVDLRAKAGDAGGSRFETETRVYLTDRSSRRRFAAYWLVVRPFSGLIRRSWLREAKRRAEA